MDHLDELFLIYHNEMSAEERTSEVSNPDRQTKTNHENGHNIRTEILKFKVS